MVNKKEIVMKKVLLSLYNITFVFVILGFQLAWGVGWVTDKSTGCKFWETDKIFPSLEITWIGACTRGKINGKGTLLWRWKEHGHTRTAIFTGEALHGHLKSGKLSRDDGKTKVIRGIEK